MNRRTNKLEKSGRKKKSTENEQDGKFHDKKCLLLRAEGCPWNKKPSRLMSEYSNQVYFIQRKV